MNYSRGLKLCDKLNVITYFHLSNDNCFYSDVNELHLTWDVYVSDSPENCAVMFHEIAHAYQMKHWPKLINLIEWNYWGRLVIEAHASILALIWLKSFYPKHEVKKAKKVLKKSFYSYL